jgi:hypothetical protein
VVVLTSSPVGVFRAREACGMQPDQESRNLEW